MQPAAERMLSIFKSSTFNRPSRSTDRTLAAWALVACSCLNAASLTDAARAQPANVVANGPDAARESVLGSVSVKNPATLYVAVAKADVYSGPSQDTYPTGLLDRGTAVEAYHRTDNGWLGIRPPSESFSWLPATDAYLLPGGKVIEITSQNAVSWIGTQLGSAKQYRWQIQLARGEQLAVLGEMTVINAEGDEVLWYKISPPRGEFRWIHEKAVSTQAPSGVTRSQASDVRTRTPNPSASAGTRVASASAQSSDTNSNVAAAGYQEQSILEGSGATEEVLPVPAGESVPAPASQRLSPDGSTQGFVDGQVILEDGSLFEQGYSMSGPQIVGNGAVVDGGVYYEDPYGGSNAGSYVCEDSHDGLPARTLDSWEGWHALDLTDEGFRSRFMERRFRESQARAANDPLKHDPFDLSLISSPASTPLQGVPLVRRPTQMVQANQAVAPRGFTPWRDPSDLREQRLLGFPNASVRNSRLRPSPLMEFETSSNKGDSVESTGLLGQLASSATLLGWDGSGGNDNTSGSDASDRTSDEDRRPNARQSSGFDDRIAAAAPGNGSNWYGVASARPAASSTTGQESQSANAADLQQVQIQLGEIVAQPMAMWNLPPLIRRTEFLIEHGATPVERGKARLLLDRIQEFQSLASKSGYVGPSPIAFTPQATTASAIQGTTTAPVATASYRSDGYQANNYQASGYQSTVDPTAGDVAFDATGWLVPVHAGRAGQPEYAITDDSGRTIAYVSGLPGMNLNRYVNQAVGISGLRGYLPQFRTNHIEAQRVVRLR